MNRVFTRLQNGDGGRLTAIAFGVYAISSFSVMQGDGGSAWMPQLIGSWSWNHDY